MRLYTWLLLSPPQPALHVQQRPSPVRLPASAAGPPCASPPHPGREHTLYLYMYMYI